MDDFSWTDSIRATVSTCLPCFSTRSADSEAEQEQGSASSRRGHQTRYEELEGLLRNDSGDTDGGDAETMSLHSNLGGGSGSGRRKRNKNKRRRTNHKSIRLFGFHLFGRPPIQLSDSENDGDEEVHRRNRNLPGRLTISRLDSAHSSSSADAETFGAFDSDASPLDPALISQLSPQDAAARAERAAAEREAEEARRRQEQLEKEERRRRRRERKELERRAAMGMDGEEFEGFPDSGSLRPPPPFSPLSPGSVSSAPTSPPAPVDEFGPYVGASPLPRPTLGVVVVDNSNGAGIRNTYGDDLPEGEDEPDFGGEVYNRKAASSSRSGRGSDSSRSHSQSQRSQAHSQASASRSNADSSQYYYPYPYPQHQHAQQQLQQQMYYPQNQGSPLPSPNNPGFFIQQTNFGAGQGSQSNMTPGAIVDPRATQPQPLSQPLKKKPKSKSKSKRSSNSSTTEGTTTSTSSRSPTSQSASLASLDSPPALVPGSGGGGGGVTPPSEPKIVQHDEPESQIHSRVIFPANSTDVPNGNANGNNTDDFDSTSSSKFPTVGFGGTRRTNSSGSTSGVFLARRGDD